MVFARRILSQAQSWCGARLRGPWCSRLSRSKQQAVGVSRRPIDASRDAGLSPFRYNISSSSLTRTMRAQMLFCGSRIPQPPCLLAMACKAFRSAGSAATSPAPGRQAWPGASHPFFPRAWQQLLHFTCPSQKLSRGDRTAKPRRYFAALVMTRPFKKEPARAPTSCRLSSS